MDMAHKPKKKFDWKKFKGNAMMCVHCQTEKEAIEFCRLMHEHGLKWGCFNRPSYLTKTNYGNYKEMTCYYGSGQYGDLEWANYNGDIICKFSAYDFSD